MSEMKATFEMKHYQDLLKLTTSDEFIAKLFNAFKDLLDAEIREDYKTFEINRQIVIAGMKLLEVIHFNNKGHDFLKTSNAKELVRKLNKICIVSNEKNN